VKYASHASRKNDWFRVTIFSSFLNSAPLKPLVLASWICYGGFLAK